MDGTATAILILSLMATVVAMAVPFAYPDAPIAVWRVLFWLGIAGMALSAIYLVMTNLSWPKMGPYSLIGTGVIAVAIGLVWLAAQRESVPMPRVIAHAAPVPKNLDRMPPRPPAIPTPSIANYPSANAPGESFSTTRKKNLGEDHREFLAKLTQLYILKHDGITSEMLAGLQLPPEDWLNAQLEIQGKTWRVRNVHGTTFDSFNVQAVAPATLKIERGSDQLDILGTFTATFFIDVIASHAPTQLNLEAKAHDIISFSIVSQGNRGAPDLGPAENHDGIAFATVMQPKGKYRVAIKTKKKTLVELSGRFEQ